MSALQFNALLTTNDFEAGMRRIRQEIRSASATAKTEANTMDSTFKNLGLAVGGYFSAQSLFGFTKELINVRGEFQKTEIAFATMLGNSDKAKDLMGEMVKLAASTPFGLQEVSKGAKQLLAFQVPASQVVDTLTRLGNIAAALNVPLERINLVYGQVRAKGKLMGDDLKQFTEAGIPMVSELAKQFKTSEGNIYKMVSAGEIGFKNVETVLKGLTNEGGMFFNLMAEQSKTLSGKVSNLGDAWEQMLNDIGTSQQGILSDGIDGLAYLIEHYKDIVDILTVLVATYGTYRAALIATTAIQRASIIAGNAQAFFQLASSIRSAKDAQLLFNTVTKANPYVVAATALAALTTAVYVYYNRVSDAERAQQELNAEIAKQQAPLTATKTKIESLVSAIKSENSSNSQRAAWLKQIQTLSNGRLNQLTVEQIRTNKASSAINGYIQQLYKEAEAKAYLQKITENTEKRDELRVKLKTKLSASDLLDDLTDLRTTHKGKDGKSLSTKERRDVRIINEINAISGAIQDAKNKVDKITKDGVDITDAVIPEPAVVEDKVKKTKKEVEKIYGEDTLKGMQQRLQKLNEQIEITPISSPKLNDMLRARVVLEDKIAAAQKAQQRTNFDEQMAEMKRQIQVRDKLMEAGVSKETVDTMFPAVKDQTYAKYLQETEASLRKLIETGKGTQETATQLTNVRKALDEFNNVKTMLDYTNESIQHFKETLTGSDLISKLEGLKKIKVGALNGGALPEEEERARLNAIDKAIDEEKKRLENSFQQMLQSQRTYEEQSLALKREFEAIKTTDGYTNATDEQKAKIKTAFDAQQGALDIDMIKKTQEWQVAFGELEGMSNTSLQAILARLLEFKEKSKGTLSLQDSAELEKAIERVRAAANNNPFKNLTQSFTDYFGKLKASKQAQKDYNEAVRDFGKDSKQANEALGKMINTDKKAIESKAKLIDTLNKGQDIFNAIGDGVKQVADAFGGMDDATQDAVNSIMEIGNAAFDLGKSIATGDVAGMIKAGLKLIGSIVSAINGDKKKERNIKRQAAALKQLEAAYNDLAFAAERAFGAQKYTDQRGLIANLQAQRAAVMNMRQQEDAKKKTDSEKMDQYNQQIQQINQQIQELKEGIIKDVLQTDIPDMASKIGDALLEAFGKGEDGIAAVNKAFDDMVKNIMRNQLNKILETQMQGVYNNILAAAGFDSDGNGIFNGFTPEEIASLRAQIQAAAANGQAFIDAWSDLFGGAEEMQEGLKGDIKGVTEKTAGALESQINAMRIVVFEILKLHQQGKLNFDAQLRTQNQIEINTRPLLQIQKDIAELNTKTKHGLAGV